MVIETLDDLTEIGGFEICDIPDPDMPHDEYEKLTEGKFILRNGGKNRLTFQIQNGPIKENGVNGCQVDTLIHVAKHIIFHLNEKFPCDENKHVLNGLQSAINWLNERKANREFRGVEGKDEL